jgi:hypothetical protein
LTKENDLTLIIYRTAACTGCPLKERCTTGQGAPRPALGA